MRKGIVVLLVFGLGMGVFLVPHAARATPATFTPVSYPLPGGIVDKSSPTLVDLDGDDRPEILVGTTGYNGASDAYDRPTYLVARHGDGSVWFEVSVGGPINSAPAVGDIDNDGDPEIVVSVGGDVNDTDHHGGIVVFNRFGHREWFFSTYDFDGNGYAEGVFSSPTLCDVDGDDDMEIAFGAWEQRIYLVDHLGNSLWNNIPEGYTGRGFLTGDSTWSTASCVDLNHDGYQEIVIGADITGGGVLPDGTPTEDGGYLYVMDKDGELLVRRFLPETVYAAPAVGDLDGDGDFEIVSGTSWYWWNAHGRTEQPYVYAFSTDHVFDSGMDYSDPAKLPHLPGWPRPTDYPGFSSPALADLDGDNDLEIVIGTSHPDLNNDDILGAGSVYAWHHTGQAVAGWPIHPRNAFGCDAPIFSSPTIADVDADGSLEVLFSMLWDVQIYNLNGSLQERLGTMWTVWGSPAVGDTDGDGRPEVWIGSSDYEDASRGYLWGWELNTVGEASVPWPMFHRNPQNTRRFTWPPRLEVAPTSLMVLHQEGSGSSTRIGLWLTNRGEGEIAWEVQDLPAGVTVSPTFGVLGWDRQRVEVTIDTSGYGPGTYALGTLTIRGTRDGQDVADSPAEIPLTLYVGDVHRTYLPVVCR
jgi:hypothetical protein